MGQRESEDDSALSESTEGNATGSEQKREDTRGGENMALVSTSPKCGESYLDAERANQATELTSCSTVNTTEEDALQDRLIEKALLLKQEGNALFKSHLYAEAALKYSDAISVLEDKVDPLKAELHIYYCNRSLCYLILENYGMK